MTETRASLDFKPMIEDFLKHQELEDPKTHKYLAKLDDEGRHELGGVLGRFDYRNKGELNAEQRLLAGRVLNRIRKPEAAHLKLINQILDYLDVNLDSVLDENEMETCVEIMELFSSAESDNDTLSERELAMLYAVLRHIDVSNNRRLDPDERKRLRRGLDAPAQFLEEQKATNPLLKELLD